MNKGAEKCIFCKIINKEIDSKIVYEDDSLVAFEDVNPQAPTHILVIPRKHIPTIDDLTGSEIELVGKIILTAKQNNGGELSATVGPILDDWQRREPIELTDKLLKGDSHAREQTN